MVEKVKKAPQPRGPATRPDLSNERFGKLVVIERVVVLTPKKQLSKVIAYLCKCDCGNSRDYTYDNLIFDERVSCGECPKPPPIKKEDPKVLKVLQCIEDREFHCWHVDCIGNAIGNGSFFEESVCCFCGQRKRHGITFLNCDVGEHGPYAPIGYNKTGPAIYAYTRGRHGFG